ncbi:MAG TPA: large conductance mechanosensitive channel protein MscL [Acidimicrobiia bacterium]|nr:large conductance mechanosensitive channel protein MscL [Acidimicrobiia bacterium]
MIREFKEFINRGNLVELAVAFVLGVAFASVVTALTTRVVSPLIGMVFNLASLETMGTFGPADPETGLPVGSVGALVQATINFLIVGLVMFFVVRGYNRLKGPDPDAEPEADSAELVLLRRIAESLERGNRSDT